MHSSNSSGNFRTCPGSAAAFGKTTRRSFLHSATAGALGGGLLASGLVGCGGSGARPGGQTVFENQGRVQSPFVSEGGPLTLPGPFPGRVVEVGHAGSVQLGKRDPHAIRSMVDFGMQQLIPEAESPEDAWRFFFQPGDRVGIKVVPVGMGVKPGLSHSDRGKLVDTERPGSISSYELVHEVVRGLESAGIKRSDILVFDRYLVQFIQAGYRAMLPEGVHWECCSVFAEAKQLEIDGQLRGQPREKNIAGYDRDVFRELPFCLPPPSHDPHDDRRFRSHLTKILTQKVDKVISLPVLKDHRSAGITMSLKNMSHGLVNNVARTHISIPENVERGSTMNHCQTFIPAAVSLPPIREKCVLQILDGLVGTYEGGPGNWCKTFSTWEYKSLFFATDPVALDHVGWEIVDAERARRGWPSVSRMGLDSESGVNPEIVDSQGQPVGESFHIRHPQHVPLAALLNLGTFDKRAITHETFRLA